MTSSSRGALSDSALIAKGNRGGNEPHDNGEGRQVLEINTSRRSVMHAEIVFYSVLAVLIVLLPLVVVLAGPWIRKVEEAKRQRLEKLGKPCGEWRYCVDCES